MCEMYSPVVDLQDVIKKHLNPDLFLLDGLHTSLEGQQTILAALVERLVKGRDR